VERGDVIYRKCRRVTVTSAARVPVQADGDPAGTLPADVQVRPAALRLLAPA
jgi:diacylglycerol kinase family enzyme